MNGDLTKDLQCLLSLSVNIASITNVDCHGILNILGSVLKSIREATRSLESFGNEKEDSFVSADSSHRDRSLHMPGSDWSKLTEPEQKPDVNQSEDSIPSVTSPDTTSEQIFLAETPKNVSKRRRQRRDKSSDDSLNDIDLSEIKETEKVNEILDFGDLYTHTSEDFKVDKILVKNVNCWRPWKRPGDVSDIVEEIVPEETCSGDDLNVIHNECALDEGRMVIDQSQNRSHDIRNQDNVLESLCIPITDIKVYDEANKETDLKSTSCDRANTNDLPSLKLPVLDQDKFLTEPISPIVALEANYGYEDRSKRLLAVNSTFDSSIVTHDKSATSPRLHSIIKSTPRTNCSKSIRNISFTSEAQVHFFNRCQGFVSVPKMGGSTLGMSYYSSHQERIPLPCDPELYCDNNLFSKKKEDVAINKENRRKSKRMSVSVSTLASVKGDETQRDTWTSSIQKPGVIKLKKMTSLSCINEVDSNNDNLQSKVKEESRSKSKNDRMMTRNSSKGNLVPPSHAMNESSVFENSFQLNTSKTTNRKGELGTRGLKRIWPRRREKMLREAGVEVEAGEEIECEELRAGRGAGCGQCPGECTQEGVECHEDVCCCSETSCDNPLGRYRYDSDQVKLHYIEVKMALTGV